ncbi:hypothetical protein [Brevundimonas sp.]|uniref:hypothetical protein n=1 Tax=Brevundimonas sp. TaxID=1871086 RepID=UPI0035690C90
MHQKGMEHFTRAWALGDLSDDEAAKVESAYRTYIDTLDHGSAVRQFATTIGLNDALVDRAIIDSGNVRLRLLTGDQQRGYWHTEITYKNARIVFGQDALAQAVQNRPTEIWYDEFSGGEPEMVHRFLLVQPSGTEDRGEVRIEFTDLKFSETPAQDRHLPPL